MPPRLALALLLLLLRVTAAPAQAAAVAASSGASAALPAASSKVSVARWADVWTVTAAQLVGAMQTPAAVVLALLPSAAQELMGSFKTNILKSGDRKMNTQQAADRHQSLLNYLQSTYSNVSWLDFTRWAAPYYSTLLANLTLSEAPHFSPLGAQARHRQLIFGLNLVSVMNMPGARLNHFALLDPYESRFYTGLVQPGPPTVVSSPASTLKGGSSSSGNDHTRRLASFPTVYDMRTVGAMPPIRDQQQCGCCWAFTSSSTLEIQQIFANKGNDVGELSSQQLVSCDVYDNGCNGGYPPDAWTWIAQNGGLTSATSFPYANYNAGAGTPACKTKVSPVVTTSVGSISSLGNDVSSATQLALTERGIMAQVMAGNPVTIAISASNACFQFYGGGLLSCSCTGGIDHVVLVVGWGANYWLIRNQWGTVWGDAGYGMLPRTGVGSSGACNMYAYSPMFLSTVNAAGETPTLIPSPQPTPVSKPSAPTRARRSVPTTSTRVQSSMAPTPKKAAPSNKPTVFPTLYVEYESQCPAATPLFCGAGRAQSCCPWFSLGGGLYTNVVCCSNGHCVQSDGTCASSGGRVLLRGVVQNADEPFEGQSN